MLGLKTFNQKFFTGLSTKSRLRKGEILRSVLTIDENTKILDIGGQLDPNGQQVVDTHPYKHNLTVVNLDPQHLEAINKTYPEVTTVEADATRLPFEDKSFDLVYSNAVIEHIPTWEGQQAMAKEIQRVGKTWFATTPNCWYPFEFHTRLPFVSWLPAKVMMSCCRVVCYNHVKQGYQMGLKGDIIRLLSKRQMTNMFPDSLVYPVKITFMPETIVVAGPKESLNTLNP